MNTLCQHCKSIINVIYVPSFIVLLLLWIYFVVIYFPCDHTTNNFGMLLRNFTDISALSFSWKQKQKNRKQKKEIDQKNLLILFSFQEYVQLMSCQINNEFVFVILKILMRNYTIPKQQQLILTRNFGIFEYKNSQNVLSANTTTI